MKIKKIDRVDEFVMEALVNLLPQLTGREDAHNKEDIEIIVKDNKSHLFMAIEDGVILGSLTLVLYRIPTSLKGIIEDVVVDGDARGKGVATKLMERAIKTARDNGATKIELTSNPTRVAANRMYKKLGFKLRETNFYRMDL